MRAALIILEEYAPHLGEQRAPGLLAGKPLSVRQLDFARACGAVQIIAFGNGASVEAKILRHQAESAGLRFSAVTNSHALPAAINDDDELLVMQSGLLAEDQTAADILATEPAILTLPSAASANSGFERIDLERSWAGAMIMPGHLLVALEDLPGDSDPTAALLRIALQAKVAEEPLDEKILATGQWSRFEVGEDMRQPSSDWVARHMTTFPLDAPSRKLAAAILLRAAEWILPVSQAVPIMLGTAALVSIGSVLAAWFGFSSAAFAMIALLVPLVYLVMGARRLAAAPLDENRLPRWIVRLFARLPDLLLLSAGVLTIDGNWQQRIFAPLMLVLLLWSSGREREPSWRNLARDRGIIAAVIALSAIGGWEEQAIMMVAVLVAGTAAQRRWKRLSQKS